MTNRFENVRWRCRNWRMWVGSLLVGVMLTVPALVEAQQPDPTKPKEPSDRQRNKRKFTRGPRSSNQPSKSSTPSKPASKAAAPKVDPELQKQIEEFLDLQGARNPAKGTPSKGSRKPSTRTPARPAGLKSSGPGRGRASRPITELPASGKQAKQGPTTSIDIPPVQSDVPPEERMYRFSFHDVTYEQLVGGFARQTGLGVIGTAPKDGKVNFATTEEMTFKEALGRIRALLFTYKPLTPYWLLREETHLEVIRINDIYPRIPKERMFRSVEEFRAADLPDDELALVIYTPKSGSLKELEVVRIFLPDYVRVTPLGGRSVIVFALVKDFKKYLDLLPIFAGQTKDPRTWEKITFKHLLPSEAALKIEQFRTASAGTLSLVGSSSRGSSRSRTKAPKVFETMRDPQVTMIPDDAQGILFVKAMKDKLEEIKSLIPFFDVDISTEPFEPVVIPLAHIKANIVIDLVKKILTGSASPIASIAGTKTGSRRSRKSAPSGVGKPTLAGPGVTLFPHPSEQAIIVLSDEFELERIRSLVSRFDQPGPVPVRLEVEHGSAGEIVKQLETVLNQHTPPMGGPLRLRLTPDPTDGAIWFVGNAKDLEETKRWLAIYDIAEEALGIHRYLPKHVKPSFIAGILRGIDRVAAQVSALPAAKRKTKAATRPRKATQLSKFTPEDENNLLLVVCSQSEWERYVPIIAELDIELDRGPPFVRILMKFIDPQEAVAQLGYFFPPGTQPLLFRFVAADSAILVLGARDSDLEMIHAYIAEIDRPVQLEKRTFVIRHRTPADMRSLIETLVETTPSQAAAVRPRAVKSAKARAPSPPLVRSGLIVIEFGDDSLIVQATPKKMNEVVQLIADYDIEAVGTELRVYDDFPAGASIEEIADTLAMVVSGAAPPSMKRTTAVLGGKTENAPRFIPQPALGRLIVIAMPDDFEEIDRLLEVLRTAITVEPFIFDFIKLEHADPPHVVELVIPLLNTRVRQLLAEGVLAPSTEPARPAPGKRPRKIGASSDHYHIDSDTRNSLVIVSAPRVLIDEIRELVARFDTPADGDVMIYRTVSLKNAEPASIVKSIKELVGTHSRAQARSKGKPTREQTLPGPDVSAVTVVEVEGSPAVFVQGPEPAVEQALQWIEQIDHASTRGRTINVYHIEYADIVQLAELIMNVVDVPQRKTARPRARRSALQDQDEDEDEFELRKNWIGAELYIQADLITNTMIVAASQSKISEVDLIVQRFTSVGEDGGELDAPPVPKHIIALEHFADAYDAVFDLEMLLDSMWDPSNEIPKVDSVPNTNLLVIRYPDRSRLAEVDELVREYIDKVDVTGGIKTKTIAPPRGMNASRTAGWIKNKAFGVDVEVIDVTEGKDETSGMTILKPKKHRSRSNRCVVPLSLVRMARESLAAVMAQTEPDPAKPATDDDQQAAPPDRSTTIEQDRSTLQDMARALLAEQRAQEKKEEKKEPEPEQERTRPKKTFKNQKLRIYVNDVDGTIRLEGPEGIIEDVPDWIEELKEEMEDLPEKPDIRVVRVRYIDVNSAAEILEEMFNATRAQRQNIQQQQRMAQQRAQLQARQQQQQARQQQRGGQQAGQRQRGQQQQPQATAAQLPPTSVRIYPHPRDRSLILRADTSQYPAIFELLATIDQPQPVDSEFKVFPLAKLSATEVEAMLRSVLGLDSGSRRQAPAGNAARRQGGGAQRSSGRSSAGRLPKTLMSETAGDGPLGIDPKDIKLSSNEQTNSIVVMAPIKAIELIGELIQQLESEQIPERLTRYYTLIHANVEHVADFLEAHFEAQAPSGKGAGKRRNLNTPSVVAFAPQNMVTVHATADQFAKIDEIVAKLDQPVEEDKWQSVALKYADAQNIAKTLTDMFGADVPARGKGGGAPGPKFVGEQGGRVLFYTAPKTIREDVVAAIGKIEQDAQSEARIRVITLEHATPSKVADAIRQAYGSGKKARGGSSSPMTISAHDPSGKVFVMADDTRFAEIESLAKSLDDPSNLGFDIRIFPLKYAVAKEVHETMTKLVTEYVRRAGASAQIEAFSVEVDDRANALVVLGGPTIFNFLEKNLARIDVPAAAPEVPGFLRVVLKHGSAAELKQTIASLWQERLLRPGEQMPQAAANPSTNMLVVRGTAAQLEEIKTKLIDPIEAEPSSSLVTESIALKFAEAELVADLINQIFDDKRQAYESAFRGRNIPPIQYTVVVTPDVLTNKLIVQASEENLKLIRARIAEIDRKDVAKEIATSVRIYAMKYADPGAVSKIINSWAKSRQGGQKKSPRRGDVVVADVETSTRSVVVTASASNHVIIEEMIEGLDSDTLRQQRSQEKLFRLTYADPGRVEDAISQLFGNTGKSGEKVVAVADFQGSAVIVKASPGDMQRVADLIASIDTEGSEQLTVHVLQLANADPKSVAQSLTEIFVRSQGPRKGNQPQAISIAALQGSKAILVKCNASDFEDIEAVLIQLDSESAALGEVVKVVQLLYGDVTEIQSAMEQYLTKPGGRGGELIGDVRLSALVQSNALVVSGSAEQIKRIETTINALDLAGEKGSVPQVIKIKHIDVAELAGNLQEMFSNQPGGARGKAPPVILANETNSTLLVRASSADYTAIIGLVEKLDVEDPDASDPFRMVALAQGINVTELAEDIENSINESAKARAKGRSGDVASLIVTPNRRGNFIMLAGSPRLFDSAEKMARAVEKMGPSGGKAVRIIPMGKLRGEDIQRLIEQLKGDSSGRGRSDRRSSSGSRSQPRPRRAGSQRSNRGR